MTRALTKFYASRKAAVAMALTGIVITVLSQLPFLSFRKDLQAVALGLVLGVNGFSRLFAADWKKHGPLHGDFLAKVFFLAWIAFVLIFAFIVLNEAFLKLW